MITIHESPISSRPFYGLGAQSDGFIYDEANATFGVNEADLALVERRLDHLRLANTRMFVSIGWFNPGLEAQDYRWDSPEYRCFLKQLERHQANGTQVNLVLFQPAHPPREQIPALIEAMVHFIHVHIRERGLDVIRWLTLWNEPESAFPHDSPLMQRQFAQKLKTGQPYAAYVDAVKLADRLLRERALPVTITAVDCVWGAQIRRERMELAATDFPEADMAFCYHNYNPEDPSYYGDPDYAYDGMGREAAYFRELVGPARPLLLTEFNATGDGFSTYFPGCNAGGVETPGSIEGAAMLAYKILEAARHGVDGFTLWCLHDMAYCGSVKAGIMGFGMWRFKSYGWHPRPIYHYYGALVAALRPGIVLHDVAGIPADTGALAFEGGGEMKLALVNYSADPRSVSVDLGYAAGTRTRVVGADIPAICDLPHAATEPVDLRQPITLAAYELSIIGAADA